MARELECGTIALDNEENRLFPVFDRSFKDFKKAGAAYIAFADPTPEELNFKTLFKPMIITSAYAIFDMTKPTLQGLKEQAKN